MDGEKAPIASNKQLILTCAIKLMTTETKSWEHK